MPSDSHSRQSNAPARTVRSRLILLLAQGLGSGLAPAGPGTAGSILGVGWFLLLLWPGNLFLFCAGAAGGVALSVWLCGEAETILGRHDPGSVVLDEIAAVPLCFLGWVIWHRIEGGEMPSGGYFLSPGIWWWTAGVFLLFRFFDIVKPWPAGAAQKLAGGWGITFDDLAAAFYVNAVILPAWAWWA